MKKNAFKVLDTWMYS